jgi:hypothetical protein
MYSSLACLVLFDARGGDVLDGMPYVIIVVCLSVFLLSLTYIPYIFHRPALVDLFCADVLSIVAHSACISTLSDPLLRHACALHSACYCIQTRFIKTKNSAIPPVLLHTVLVLLLLAAYVYGPRITEIRQFMIGAVCPHVLELGATLLINLHGVLVTFWLEKCT